MDHPAPPTLTYQQVVGLFGTFVPEVRSAPRGLEVALVTHIGHHLSAFDVFKGLGVRLMDPEAEAVLTSGRTVGGRSHDDGTNRRLTPGEPGDGGGSSGSSRPPSVGPVGPSPPLPPPSFRSTVVGDVTHLDASHHHQVVAREPLVYPPFTPGWSTHPETTTSQVSNVSMSNITISDAFRFENHHQHEYRVPPTSFTTQPAPPPSPSLMLHGQENTTTVHHHHHHHGRRPASTASVASSQHRQSPSVLAYLSNHSDLLAQAAPSYVPSEASTGGGFTPYGLGLGLGAVAVVPVIPAIASSQPTPTPSRFREDWM